jgi:hypothetical protein
VADELYISGSLLRLSETTVEGRGLGRSETTLPSYSLDLGLLSSSGGELYPVLSANARQQLRRALRHFESYGPLQLGAAATTAEALGFFAELKALHCASWERRGKTHSFSGEFFEPFHRLLIERSFTGGGTQLLRATAGDRVIGYLYNFRLGDRIYAYQSGFADAGRRERPGIVTPALAIRHAFQSGAPESAVREIRTLRSMFMISWRDAIGSKKVFQPGASRCCDRSFSSRAWPFASNTSAVASSTRSSRQNPCRRCSEAIGQAAALGRLGAELVI